MKSPKYSGKLKKPKPLILRRVVGQSMLPTLRPDKIVVATSWFKVIKPGQVVVFRHGRIEKIKRVKDIKRSRIFLIGDNLHYSDDSRVFGWLPIESIIAKVIWPRL